MSLTRIVVLAAGAYGLWVCVPGFRPKHVRDILSVLFSLQGLGAAAYLALLAGLLPAASRLSRLGATATVMGSLFLCLGSLLFLELVACAVPGLSSLQPWPLRLAYLALAAWGWSGRQSVRALLQSITRVPRRFWRELGAWPWKVFAVVVGLFFFRQEMHTYISHGAPFGDEVGYWFPAPRRLLEGGLRAAIEGWRYTPGVPWLASFAARFFGVSGDVWLFPFPIVVMAGFAALLFELSASGFALLTGTTVLFFVFLSSRDLFHIFGGSLYGEATATLLLAVLAAEALFLKTKALTLETWGRRPFRRLAGLAGLLGLSALTKPPLSVLALGIVLVLAAAAFFSARRWPSRIQHAGLVPVAGLTGYLVWKGLLSGAESEHAFSIKGIAKAGFHPEIPLGMLRGLFTLGSFQFAYTAGLIAALLIVASLRQWRLLFVYGITLAVYWGFVLGLYATLWHGVEYGSAGRYLSHAAIACVLILPLAFSPKRAI